MTLYIDTRPNEPIDKETADRFKAVELPAYFFDGGYHEYTNGFNKCLECIYDAIDKAKEKAK